METYAHTCTAKHWRACAAPLHPNHNPLPSSFSRGSVLQPHGLLLEASFQLSNFRLVRGSTNCFGLLSASQLTCRLLQFWFPRIGGFQFGTAGHVQANLGLFIFCICFYSFHICFIVNSFTHFLQRQCLHVFIGWIQFYLETLLEWTSRFRFCACHILPIAILVFSRVRGEETHSLAVSVVHYAFYV